MAPAEAAGRKRANRPAAKQNLRERGTDRCPCAARPQTAWVVRTGLHDGLPRDLPTADNEAGRRSSLAKLAALVEGGVIRGARHFDFVARSAKGLVQPALKCCGREYLRVIYGPAYDLPATLERLRQRGLSGKRSLAIREFCLGIEALKMYVIVADLL